jgi:anti-sigma B factor antagonist
LSFSIREYTGDLPVIKAAGELDMAAVSDLRDALAKTIIERRKLVVLDITEATFIDSMTIGALVAAHRRVQRYGGVLEIGCANPKVLRTFEFAGLRRALRIHESLDGILQPAAQPA